MSEYFYETDGVIRDELAGGAEFPLSVWNVNVGASAVIERGQLLCASSPTAEFKLVTDASDASKVLGIAACDFTADDTHTVTTAYVAGVFNGNRIKLGGDSTLTLEPFANELRKQNLHITNIKDLY